MCNFNIVIESINVALKMTNVAHEDEVTLNSKYGCWFPTTGTKDSDTIAPKKGKKNKIERNKEKEKLLRL